jgi:N6-adenosine-specific RNA methylase IME4
MEIAKIKIFNRHRKDLGDVGALAKNIKEIGLLHPVVVTPSNMLIAGGRRLAACIKLGWSEIPVTVVDLADVVHGEFSENAIRKDFLPSEINAIRRTLEAVVGTPVGRPSNKVETFHNNKPGKTRDKIGDFAGVSGRTVEKIGKVIDAAEENPIKFAHLVEEMDRTGKVNGAYRKLKMADDEERVMSLQPTVGKYKTLIFDPPWDYESLSIADRAAPGYATMTHEDLLGLDVGQWAEDDCHMYLWTTNNFMPRAINLMAHWGFEHKTILAWFKPRWGLGSYFRNQTELVLFGVKGNLRTRVDNISTIIEGPMGKHSEKPESFYDIVRKASYLPAGEAFQRKERKGFENLFEAQTNYDGDFDRSPEAS